MSVSSVPAPASKPRPIGAATPDEGAFRRRRRFASQVIALGHCAIGTLCLAAVLGLRHLAGRSAPLNAATLVACAVFLLLCAATVVVLHRRAPTPPPAGQVAAIYCVVALAIYPPLFLDRPLGLGVSRLALLLFEALTILALTVWYQFRAIRPASRAGFGRNLALIGSADACREFACVLRSRPGAQVHTLVVENDGLRGGLEAFEKLLREMPLDEVLLPCPLFDCPPQQMALYRAILDICERSRIGIHIGAPPLQQYDRVHLDHVAGSPVLTFEYAPDESWPLLAKRAVDIGLATAGLVLAAPLLVLAGLAILIEDGRPILFRQTRAGLRGRPFTIYKLRTMARDAESQLSSLEQFNEMSSIVFKMAHDPRITRVGRWLRMSSLDEVPQLYNVLRGEMSLVGPRPPIPSELGRYQLDHLRRLAMKPGITGLWQVSGRNRIKSFERWVELDTQYIRTWSLALDSVILLRTIWAVLKMTGR
jgi:exopolysaccharide biosynthesis polyprenyl glycosylphosphotransferase